MPGKSKKGGGLTVKKSALYKKQKFGEAKSPFTMERSPAKQAEILSPAFYGGGAMGVADFLMGPAAGLAYLGGKAYQSGQKHSGGKAVKGQKSFMEESKKKTKSIWNKKK